MQGWKLRFIHLIYPSWLVCYLWTWRLCLAIKAYNHRYTQFVWSFKKLSRLVTTRDTWKPIGLDCILISSHNFPVIDVTACNSFTAVPNFGVLLVNSTVQPECMPSHNPTKPLHHGCIFLCLKLKHRIKSITKHIKCCWQNQNFFKKNPKQLFTASFCFRNGNGCRSVWIRRGFMYAQFCKLLHAPDDWNWLSASKFLLTGQDSNSLKQKSFCVTS